MKISIELATIIAAVVAAVVGLISSRVQISIELRKWPRAREDAIAVDLRRAIQEYATLMASAVHSMCWLTWAATCGHEFIDSDRLMGYNQEQHGILPKISGSLSVIAALDKDAYEKLAPIAEELYGLDAKVGELTITFKADGEKAIQKLAKLHSQVAPFEREVPRRIAGIVSRRVEERANLVSKRKK
jgi:hypothetical protein